MVKKQKTMVKKQKTKVKKQKRVNFGATRFDEWRMWGPVKMDWEFMFIF